MEATVDGVRGYFNRDTSVPREITNLEIIKRAAQDITAISKDAVSDLMSNIKKNKKVYDTKKNLDNYTSDIKQESKSEQARQTQADQDLNHDLNAKPSAYEKFKAKAKEKLATYGKNVADFASFTKSYASVIHYENKQADMIEQLKNQNYTVIGQTHIKAQPALDFKSKAKRLGRDSLDMFRAQAAYIMAERAQTKTEKAQHRADVKKARSNKFYDMLDDIGNRLKQMDESHNKTENINQQASETHDKYSSTMKSNIDIGFANFMQSVQTAVAKYNANPEAFDRDTFTHDFMNAWTALDNTGDKDVQGDNITLFNPSRKQKTTKGVSPAKEADATKANADTKEASVKDDAVLAKVDAESNNIKKEVDVTTAKAETKVTESHVKDNIVTAKAEPVGNAKPVESKAAQKTVAEKADMPESKNVDITSRPSEPDVMYDDPMKPRLSDDDYNDYLLKNMDIDYNDVVDNGRRSLADIQGKQEAENDAIMADLSRSDVPNVRIVHDMAELRSQGQQKEKQKCFMSADQDPDNYTYDVEAEDGFFAM